MQRRLLAELEASMRILLPCILVLLGLSVAERSRAQGINRESLAGQNDAASALVSDRQSVVGQDAAQAGYFSDQNQPYNLQLGPVSLRCDANLSANYNDNINVAYTGRESDMYFEPLVNFHLLWNATEINSLTFDMGVGYQAYLDHTGNNGFVISPDSASKLQFNIFVGDFKFNVHDIFSLEQDPLTEGQLSNTSQFVRFENTAGVRVDWDLNSDVVLSLGYDHMNYWVFETQYDYLNNQSDTISPSVSVVVGPTISAGVTSSFSTVRYDQDVQNNYTSVSAGPFVTAQLSDYINLNAGVGVYIADYSQGGLNGDTSNNDTYYANIGVSHRINDVLTQSLTAGRQALPGLTSNFTNQYYAYYTLNWQALSVFQVQTNLSWQNLEDSNATIRQTSNIYSARLNLTYSLNDHSSLQLGYQYTLKDANPVPQGYYQDLVTLGYQYQF